MCTHTTNIMSITLTFMLWLGLGSMFTNCEETLISGMVNTMVNCAACQSAKRWYCDVKCEEVSEGSNGIHGGTETANARTTDSELLEMMKQLNESLREEINQLKSSACSCSVCAFSSRGSTGLAELIGDEAVLFDVEDLDTCDAYDSTTGVFSATVAGTYFISAYVTANQADGGPIRIKKNDVNIAEANVIDGKSAVTTLTVVTSLEVEDEVRVTGKETDKVGILETMRGFSGVLIQADN